MSRTTQLIVKYVLGGGILLLGLATHLWFIWLLGLLLFIKFEPNPSKKAIMTHRPPTGNKTLDTDVFAFLKKKKPNDTNQD